MTTNNIGDAQAFLGELFDEVSKAEGHLSGGKKLHMGAAAIKSLMETKICLGNPLAQLIRITPELFEATKIEMNPILKHQMDTTFDFYYMTMPLSFVPGASGAQFHEVIVDLDFGPKGRDELIIERLFPESEWHQVLIWGGGMSLGLDGNVDWNLGIDSPKGLPQIGGSIQSKIANKNELHALITVPNFRFEVGRSDVIASGRGSSSIRWIVKKPDLKQTHNADFGVIFKLPKAAKTIELEGQVYGQLSMPWLAANLSDVLDVLSKRLLEILRMAKPIPPYNTDREQWQIQLPQ